MRRVLFLRLTLGAAMLLTLVLASCNYARNWRNSQVAQSHAIAKGSTITPPAAPPAKAEELAGDLPVDASWNIVEYKDSGSAVHVLALNSWDAEKTCLWLLSRLSQLGYDSGDNPSRLLEGVDYSGSGKYKTLHIKVDENTANQVTVAIDGS